MKPVLSAFEHDLYARLQVHPTADPAVIKAAWKALMSLKHPDHGSTVRTSQEINEAYNVIGDDALRQQYDKYRRGEGVSGKLVGAYRVKSKIAAGGFGRTYLAEHVVTGLPVCIKDCAWPEANIQAILLRETKLLWDLRHFALPAVRELVRTDDGRYFLVMSYIPGKNLFDIVEEKGRLDAESVAWITERLLNALHYLHYNGVVHGDIKPQNIIVQETDHTVCLVDFGLSQVKPDRDTQADGYTEHFSPQEQLQGKPLIPETDFYSLGMTMLFLLGGGIETVVRKEVPSTVPDAMCDFIRSLIVRDVMRRPNWNKRNITEEFQRIRVAAFGRSTSGMKPIRGVKS